MDVPPIGKPGFDLHADQRGRIIGSYAAIITLTIIFVFLRLLSRKLSRAGYWVSSKSWMQKPSADRYLIISGTIS